jgi:hypothetical protein
MGQLKVDGIKIGPEIDCTSIGKSRMLQFEYKADE